jgi:site-specific DNA-cytosine methylase
MKILVGCEESQAVTIELRKLGHEAYSCDILPCSGGHPEWHLQQDITEILKQDWDMIIGFPPCTYLTVTGNRWFNIERYGEKAIKRHEQRKEAIKFFMLFANANCKKNSYRKPCWGYEYLIQKARPNYTTLRAWTYRKKKNLPMVKGFA